VSADAMPGLVAVPLIPRVSKPSSPEATTPLWHALVMFGDVLGVGALILCFPFVILGVGIPIALLVQLVLWIARLF
jgi:hypothetical protein